MLKTEADISDDHGGLSFVFPYGCSLNVDKPAIPLLSSGPLSHPINRPLAAIYTPKTGKGKLLVLGSYKIFDDTFLEKEENSKLQDILFRWLTGENLELEEGL